MNTSFERIFKPHSWNKFIRSCDYFQATSCPYILFLTFGNGIFLIHIFEEGLCLPAITFPSGQRKLFWYFSDVTCVRYGNIRTIYRAGWKHIWTSNVHGHTYNTCVVILGACLTTLLCFTLSVAVAWSCRVVHHGLTLIHVHITVWTIYQVEQTYRRNGLVCSCWITFFLDTYERQYHQEILIIVVDPLISICPTNHSYSV